MSGTGTLPETRQDERGESDQSRRRPPAAVSKLGEELPIFCERCGYSLHGLPQCRCEACTLLHFVCPECNHRQPINTLRPAAQRIIGRIRAAYLVASVFFKLNWFGWLLFAWFAMGVEWSYTYNYGARGSGGPTFLPHPVDYESILGFAMFALPFGLFSRMLLLRWRRGILVGAVLAVLVVAVASVGGWFRTTFDSQRAAPLGGDFLFLLVVAAASVILGAAAAWPIWMVLVRAFVPTHSAKALLDWQRSLSVPAAAQNAARGLDAPNSA